MIKACIFFCTRKKYPLGILRTARLNVALCNIELQNLYAEDHTFKAIKKRHPLIPNIRYLNIRAKVTIIVKFIIFLIVL